MTLKQAVTIASRYVVVFLLVAAMNEAIHLPSAVLALQWDLQRAAVPRDGMPLGLESEVVHYLRESILRTATIVLLITLNLAGAFWFYRAGPFLQRFFSDSSIDVVPSPSDQRP